MKSHRQLESVLERPWWEQLLLSSFEVENVQAEAGLILVLLRDSSFSPGWLWSQAALEQQIPLPPPPKCGDDR